MNDEQRKWIYWAIPVVVVIGIAVALYYGRTQRQADVESVAETELTPASEEPEIRHPVPEETNQVKPLPSLNESDRDVQESLGGIVGRSLEPFIEPKNIVRNVVVTIDNLPRKKIAVQRRPLKPTPGEFTTSGDEGNLTLGEANFERYEPLVNVVQGVEAGQIASLYRHYYPLFQQAYADQGYPEGYFNDRLVEVIDHLLETPEVQGPIRLTQPSVHYEFADRALEERSAGQKLLIRMGPKNAAAIKAKLRELRNIVANLERPQQETAAGVEPDGD